MLNSKILIGTMSGTSLDGIDIALTKLHKNKISEEHFPDFTSEKWIIYNLSNFNLNNDCKE